MAPSVRAFTSLANCAATRPTCRKYTYNKIYNSKAYNVCSEMPRFGHVGALKPEQIKDLVALLLDPESPVNK